MYNEINLATALNFSMRYILHYQFLNNFITLESDFGLTCRHHSWS